MSDTSSAQAFSYRHVDRLAVQLAGQAQSMHREVHAHFRSTPMFRHLDADVDQMEKLAAHIHEVAHNRGNIAHLRADVARLDQLFHHIEELIAQMVRTCNVDRHALIHFRQTMGSVNFTLHHLQDDLRQMDYHDPNHYLPSPGHGHGHVDPGHGHGAGYRRPVYVAPSRTIRVGNSRFGIQIRLR